MGRADLINRPAIYLILSDIGWRLSPDFYTQFADICCYPGPLRWFEKEYARCSAPCRVHAVSDNTDLQHGRGDVGRGKLRYRNSHSY